jgi:hypothetical protein
MSDWVYILRQRNRLGSVEEAYSCLHQLQHLNGVAFRDASDLLKLNPAIVRALCSYNLSRGSTYRLYSRYYWMKTINDEIDFNPSLLHASNGADRERNSARFMLVHCTGCPTNFRDGFWDL